MSLDSSLSVAAGALANINRHLAVVSQNVANVGTPGYAREVMRQTSATADGQAMGVRSGLVVRELDVHIQAAVLQHDAQLAALATRQAALARIDAAHGTPGSGGDLAARMGKLGDAISALSSDPAATPRQVAAVQTADDLVRHIHELATTFAATRQAAHDDLAAGIQTLNATLARLGSLSQRIIDLRAQDRSTADLENQRDSAKTTLSRLLDVRYLDQANGDLVVVTPAGLSLPIHGTTAAMGVAAATLGPGAYWPGGGVPPITLRGKDVTGQIDGGTLGGNRDLRDRTLPIFQAELDEFARSLSERFDAQGLRLFTDPAGAVPAPGGVPVQSGYVGYAGVIQVNPTVAGDPRLVRDGTHVVTDNPAGAAGFTPNPVGGPAGFATLLDRIRDRALGSEVRPGVAQPAAPTSLLGPDGTLDAPYAPATTLASHARALVAAQAEDSAQNSDDLATASALQTSLSDKLAAGSAVSIDREMTTMLQLQSAYAANARVISAVQAMWTQTLQMLR